MSEKILIGLYGWKLWRKQMNTSFKSSVLVLLLFCSAATLYPLSINIRAYDHADFTRIVFEGNSGFSFSTDNIKDGKLVLKLDSNQKLDGYRVDSEGSDLVEKVEFSPEKKGNAFKIIFKNNISVVKNFVLEKPFRVVFDVRAAKIESSNINSGNSAETGKNQEQTEYKPLSKEAITIDTICIDPGHGGTDLGAVGKGGMQEKEITLSVAKKLKKRVERSLGLRVIMTRTSDVEVALDSRVSRANNQKAQLFISIHVNSSFRRSARGPETYYVSLKATDQESHKLAMKENGTPQGVSEQQNDELNMILWNMAQTEYIKESSKLAEYIQNELNVVMNTVNRGVKQAPFRVLMRASMPAVLIEIAFVSNKYEEIRMKDDNFLDSVSGAIFRGISNFIKNYNSRFK